MFGKIIVEEVLYLFDMLFYGVQVLMYVNIYIFEREDFYESFALFFAMKKFFCFKGIKIIFRGEIIVYIKVYIVLKKYGLDVDLLCEVSVCFVFYL